MPPDPLYPGRPPAFRGIAYATGAAIEDARNMGLTVRRNDWRDIFLAITDTMAIDGERSLSSITAHYVGEVRDGERWSVLGYIRPFDALYNPQRAQIFRVTRQRGSEAVPVSAMPGPDPRSRPLISVA